MGSTDEEYAKATLEARLALAYIMDHAAQVMDHPLLGRGSDTLTFSGTDAGYPWTIVVARGNQAAALARQVPQAYVRGLNHGRMPAEALEVE